MNTIARTGSPRSVGVTRRVRAVASADPGRIVLTAAGVTRILGSNALLLTLASSVLQLYRYQTGDE